MLRTILLGYGCKLFPTALEGFSDPSHPFLLFLGLHLPINDIIKARLCSYKESGKANYKCMHQESTLKLALSKKVV